MTDKRTQAEAARSHMEKDPGDWVTGDEPMTGAQRSYLKTLCEEAKQPFDDSLTKAQASRRIEELQSLTGRGAPAHPDERAVDESPLESLGEAITAPILGSPGHGIGKPRR